MWPVTAYLHYLALSILRQGLDKEWTGAYLCSPKSGMSPGQKGLNHPPDPLGKNNTEKQIKNYFSVSLDKVKQVSYLCTPK
ncbi:hypothetical protein GCM10027577_00790 [Spirosoma fluminis]